MSSTPARSGVSARGDGPPLPPTGSGRADEPPSRSTRVRRAVRGDGDRAVRAPLLTTPTFVVAVIVLLANDHVLKSAWPGFVTGKLSDVAGVAMVAIGLTALLRRSGIAIGATAVAFVALKTVPAVAVVAAPLLGGLTRTDPTDLIALVILPPVWLWLRRPPRAQPAPSRSLLPLRIVIVAAAVFATTATSTDGESVHGGFGSFGTTGSEAFVWNADDEVYRSRDGGLTWRRIRNWSLPSAHEVEGGATSRCVEGTCWSVDGGRVVRRDRTGATTASPLPDGPTVRPGNRPQMVTVAVDGQVSVLARYPGEGVLRIGPDERVTWHAESDFEHTPAVQWTLTVMIVVMFAGPLAMLVSASAAWRSALRRGLRPDGVQALVIGAAVGLLGLALFAAFVAMPIAGDRVIVYFAVPIAAVSAIVVAWSWWSAGRAPSPLSPPDQPGAFSRVGGSTLPPPDRHGRLG